MKKRYTKVIKALEQLVYAKDYKDLYGKCAHYEEMRKRGWELAREVLAEHEANNFIQKEAVKNKELSAVEWNKNLKE